MATGAGRSSQRIRKSKALAAAVALSASGVAVATIGSATPASAEAGYRMCYQAQDDGSFLYRKRVRSSECSSFGYRDMPTLERDGELVDFSICEEFTYWHMEIKEWAGNGDKSLDVCEHMDEWSWQTLDRKHTYTMQELWNALGIA